MNRSLFETILGAVVLLIAATFLWMAYSQSDIGKPAEGYRVTASFSSADGLKPGVDVRVAGVKVGSVEKLKLDHTSYQAVATIQLNTGVKVPVDSVAQISSESLLGGKYIALQIGGSDDTLKPGDKFEYTQAAANLEALLGQAIFSRNNTGGTAPAGDAAQPAATATAPATVTPPVEAKPETKPEVKSDAATPATVTPAAAQKAPANMPIPQAPATPLPVTPAAPQG